jgi:hypothetical protein
VISKERSTRSNSSSRPPTAAVLLAELYAQTGRWDDVIELTEGIKNEDDAAALLCVFRGQAFRQQGFPRRCPRGAQGGAALALKGGVDPTPRIGRAGAELPRPRQREHGP